MTRVNIFVFLSEIIIMTLGFIFYKDILEIVDVHKTYSRVLYVVTAGMFMDAVRHVYKFVSHNLKTEANIMKQEMQRISDVMEDYVKKSNNVETFIESFNFDIKSVKASICEINRKLERKRELEIERKEFKQELDEIWGDYSVEFKNDETLYDFASLLFRKLQTFVVTVHKYDMTDVNVCAIRSQHEAVMEEIKALVRVSKVPSSFINSFFRFARKKNYKFMKKCEYNFTERKLNSKRQHFKNDAERYIMILLDGMFLVWDNEGEKNET